MVAAPEPEMPAWLAVVKAAIPADIPHVLVFCERRVVRGEKVGAIGVAAMASPGLAKDLLQAGLLFLEAHEKEG